MSSQAVVLVNAQYSNQVLQVDYRPWWIRDFKLPQSTFDPGICLLVNDSTESRLLGCSRSQNLEATCILSCALLSIPFSHSPGCLPSSLVCSLQSGPPPFSFLQNFLKLFFLIKKPYVLTVTLIQIT